MYHNVLKWNTVEPRCCGQIKVNFCEHSKGLWQVNLSENVNIFIPRSLLKGPKRSFVVVVVVFLLLGVKKWVKNGKKRTKNVYQQNVFQIKQKMFTREQKIFAMEIAPNWT